MGKNIKECVINAFECKWTGKNIKEITRFFKLCEYKSFHFVEDDNKQLLYDEFEFIEEKTIIIANSRLGIIAKFKEI